MTAYFLSGLGADKRIFSRLVLPPHINVVHIDWIPNLPDERLSDYARRLSKQINTSQPFRIVGVSFGGIVAAELAKIVKPQKVIIISSIATRRQLPAYFTLSAGLFQHPFFPKSALKSVNPFSLWLFGAQTEQSRDFFRQILSQSDENFLKWAIRKIIDWDNSTKADNLFHIHGSCDKIFPLAFVKPDYIVKNGEHLMVYDRHQELSKILTELLSGE